MHVRPTTSADIPQCGEISAAAFMNDELFAVICPRKEECPIGWRSVAQSRLRKHLVTPGTYCVVCVDGDVILGHARWERSGRISADDPWMTNNRGTFNALERLLLTMESTYDLWFHANSAMSYAAFAKVQEAHARVKIFDEMEGHWYLAYFVVHPKHQRKGVGQMLMDWGVERSAATGVAEPMSVISSVAGKKLYLNNGFEIVGTAPFKELLGCRGECMIRPAQLSEHTMNQFGKNELEL